MAMMKLFSKSSSRKQSEISLVYQSVTESTPLGLYERVGNDGASSSSSSSPAENTRGSKTLKLGGNSIGMATRTRVMLICLLKAPSNFICKVKEHYAHWKDGARSANIRVSDLFVANQVFMHMQTSPVTNRRKQQGLKPSAGFVTRVETPSPGSQREMRER